MARGTTFVAVLALLAAGCTCAIDPDQYLGGRDAALPDGALPDGALPDGALPDGALPDGGDAGPTENLPPLGSGVGLSDFGPVPGDTLSVTIGPVFDANLDPLTQTIEWTHNGAPLEGETGATLLLDPAVFSAGDQIGVVVTFDDGTLSDSVSAGPAVVQPDATRWNLLLPPRGGEREASSATFDPARQRLLWRAARGATDFGLWEYQLSDGVTPRWVHLENVTGTPPDAFGNAVIPDPDRDRIIFLFGLRPGTMGMNTPVNSVWALGTEGDQGSETWSRIVASGDLPSARVASATTTVDFADGSEAIFVYGGLANDVGGFDSALNDAYFMRLDGDRWEQIGADLLPTTVVLPATFHDPDSGLLYIAGGALMSGAAISGTTAVYSLDADSPSGGFTPAGFDLPNAIFGGMAIVEDGVAYIFGGAESIVGEAPPVPNRDIFRVDLATNEVTTLDGGTDGPTDPFGTVGSRRPFASEHIVFSRGFGGRSLRFLGFDPSTAAWSPITGQEIDMPPPLMKGIGADRSGSGAAFFGGLVDADNFLGSGDTWLWNPEGRFEALDLMGEPTDGSPSARWGMVMDTSQPYGFGNFFLVGGRFDGGIIDSRVWQGNVNDNRWGVHRFSGPAPPDLEGHVLIRGYCQGSRGNLVGYHGGRDPATGVMQAATMMSDCAVGGDFWRDCRWFNPLVNQNNSPGARAWAAATQLVGAGGDQRNTFLFGGLTDGSGPMRDAYYFDACSGTTFPTTWVRAVVTGDVPPGVHGHSFTATLDSAGLQSRSYLLFGGGDEGNSNDVFRVAWDGDTTTPVLSFRSVVPAGDAPDPRIFHIATYDAEEDRILVYGGFAEGDVADDLWELVLRE